MVAGAAQGKQGGGHGGHARRAAVGGLAALQRRQLAAQVAHGGVEGAAVQVAAARGALVPSKDLRQRVRFQNCVHTAGRGHMRRHGLRTACCAQPPAPLLARQAVPPV